MEKFQSDDYKWFVDNLLKNNLHTINYMPFCKRENELFCNEGNLGIIKKYTKVGFEKIE